MSRADKILSFIRRYYAEAGKSPSVLVICKNTDLTIREFYEIYGGVAEAAKAAGVPVSKENIEATRKANDARRAGVGATKKGVDRYRSTILEVKINSPPQMSEGQEVEQVSPIMLESMKEDILSRAIDLFRYAMEISEREIDGLKTGVSRRIAAGENTEEYFLGKYREMGLRGESLDEVFRDMLQKARERELNKVLQISKLRQFPDLLERFMQLTL